MKIKVTQGSKGIRQWPINISTSPTIDNTQNYPFYRLQLVVETFGQSTKNEPTNQNSIKVSKVVKPTNKKTILIDFGN